MLLVLVIASGGAGYFVGETSSKTTTTTLASTTTVTDVVTTTAPPSVYCLSSACVNVTIPIGVSSPPTGYAFNGTTTYGYTPDTITVVLGKNNTVFWTNDDVAPHTVTSDAGDPVSFDSGASGALTKQGGTFQFTFTVTGTYYYHCIFHVWMQGTVIVLPASSLSTTTT